jgi:diadenosine tetraphosphate (Ap4A) HIT family hydrolase
MMRGVTVMDCAFCAEFAAPAGPEQGTRIICEASGWVLLPTVGCFAPGYCLFMPLDHIDAVADAEPAELAMVSEAVEDMRALISRAFGSVIVAEHGPRGCELGAGCCSHAHLHLIPVPDVDRVTGAYQATGGQGRRLSDLAHLPDAVDGPYLYLSPRPGEHLLWPSAGFARQYVRRVCAVQYGAGDRFDWRDHPFEAEQELTATVLRARTRSTAA